MTSVDSLSIDGTLDQEQQLASAENPAADVTGHAVLRGQNRPDIAGTRTFARFATQVLMESAHMQPLRSEYDE